MKFYYDNLASKKQPKGFGYKPLRAVTLLQQDEGVASSDNSYPRKKDTKGYLTTTVTSSYSSNFKDSVSGLQVAPNGVQKLFIKFKNRHMVIKLYCPQNIDIEAVTKSSPFAKGKVLKKDHLLFIIHCIMQQRASKDDEHLRKIGKSNGFVPLHSKILESKIPGYHACIEYLINAGIIECDGKYFPGKASKGYRLTKPYRGNSFKQVEVSDFILCQKIKRDKPFDKKNESANEYPYLAKWFKSEKLEIDEQAAISWINKLESYEFMQINNNKSYNAQRRLEEKDLLFEKIRNHKILVSRIKEKDYFFHKDDTGNRLHTNLTNLPKGLRQFLTYDGQELVSIDIKNSQPYMSIPLLGKEFWQSKNLPGKPTLKKTHRELYEEMEKDR